MCEGLFTDQRCLHKLENASIRVMYFTLAVRVDIAATGDEHRVRVRPAVQIQELWYVLAITV